MVNAMEHLIHSNKYQQVGLATDDRLCWLYSAALWLVLNIVNDSALTLHVINKFLFHVNDP